MFNRLSFAVILCSVAFSHAVFAQKVGNNSGEFGAIAIDSTGTKAASSVGHATMQEAQLAAVKKCGDGCNSVVEFGRECAAVAGNIPKRKFLWGHGKDLTSAEASARLECGGNCRTIASACNLQ